MSAKTWVPAVVLLMAAGFAGVGVALATGPWREGGANAPAAGHRRPAREDLRNVVEKDGVRFEILVPEREWPIPEDKGGARTPIKLGLRITNRTDKPLRFTRFDTLYSEMTGPDGKPLRPSGGRNVTLPMKESDCPLVKPGDGVTFDIDAQLFWQSGKLRFGGSDGFGGVWGFADEFRPGRYRLRIGYTNAATEHEVGRARRMALKGIWTGEVKTPFVEVSLTRQAADAVKDDLRKLQGTWRLVAAEEGGIPVPPQNLGKNTWVFRGDKGRSKSGRREFEGIVTLDPAKDPRWIDVKLSKDITLQGIYELKGNTLRLFFVPQGTGRPTEFRTEKGTQLWLGTYERAGADPEAARGLEGAVLTASKAVRVGDVDFQAVIEPRCPAPGAGAPRPIDLGLRVTNRGTKALLLDLNRITPALKSADGQPVELRGERLRSAFAAPMQLGPGESQTVLWRGRLEQPKDAESFALTYTDGTYYSGTFSPMRPGKFRLRLRYEADRQAVQTLLTRVGNTPEGLVAWEGSVTTEEAEFEVVPGAKGDARERPAGILIAELESADGRTRLAATNELFARGKAALPDLEKAGAKLIAPAGTINPRRLDVVYSLLKGLPPNPPGARGGYKADSFGLHLEIPASRGDVERMGRQYGFALAGNLSNFARPNCYVILTKGQGLAEVMRAVLGGEVRVINVSLNYFEQ